MNTIRLYSIIIFLTLGSFVLGHSDSTTKQQTAALGVSLLPTPSPIAKTLKIEEGVGMTITGIAPDSAFTGKLNKNDILYMFNNQYIINLEQLQTLLNMHKPGDLIQLTAFAKNKKTTLEVELVSRPYTPINRDLFKFEMPQIELKPFDVDDLSVVVSQFDQLTAQEVDITNPDNLIYEKAVNLGTRTSTIEMDENYQYTLNSNNSTITFAVKEIKTGKTVFEKPVSTEEQIERIPEKFRRKVGNMLKMVSYLQSGELTPADNQAEIEQILNNHLPCQHMQDATQTIKQMKELLKSTENVDKKEVEKSPKSDSP